MSSQEVWGITAWNKANGVPKGISCSPSARARLIEAGARRGYDWDCIWRPDFSRLCVIERGWTHEELSRIVSLWETRGMSEQRGRDVFRVLWTFGVVKFPLVCDGTYAGDPVNGAPRDLYERDIETMLRVRTDSGEKTPMQEKEAHNQQLDEFRARESAARDGDIVRNMVKGKPVHSIDYICPHRKRSRACPACNPRQGYIGGMRKAHLSDGELAEIGVG